MERYLAAALLVGLCASMAMGQSKDGPKDAQSPDSPWGLVQRAEAAIQDKKLDEALVLLWRAQSNLDDVASESVRSATRVSIDRLLLRVDPKLEDRKAAFEVVGKSIDGLAKSYVRKKWLLSAKQLLVLGSEYSESAVTKRLAYVEKRLLKISAAAAKDAPAVEDDAAATKGPKDRIEGFKVQSSGAGVWQRAGGELVSPPAGEASAYLISANVVQADNSVKCDVRLDSESDGQAAVVFGALSSSDYFLAEFCVTKKRPTGFARLHHYDGLTLTTLARTPFGMAADQLGAWHELEVRVRDNGRSLEMLVDGTPRVTAVAPRAAHGLVGVFVTGAPDPKPYPVQFRKLFVEELPPVAASKGSEGSTQPSAQEAEFLSAVTVMEVGEALLKDGASEAGVLKLRGAKFTLQRIGSLQADALVDEIDKLIAAHDRCLPERQKRGREMAAALGVLAESYVREKRPRAALALCRDVARFDAEVGDAVRERVIALMEKADRDELIGIPVEVSTAVVDNAALKLEFEAGKNYYTDAPWVFGEESVTSSGGMLVGVTDHRVFGRVEVQVRGDAEGYRGVVFGFRSRTDFWVAGLAPNGVCFIAHYYGDKWGQQVRRTFRFVDAAQSEWMTIWVEFDAKSITARFGGAEPITLSGPKSLRVGRLGFDHGRGAGGALEFRNFRFEAAAEPPPEKR